MSVLVGEPCFVPGVWGLFFHTFFFVTYRTLRYEVAEERKEQSGSGKGNWKCNLCMCVCVFFFLSHTWMSMEVIVTIVSKLGYNLLKGRK